MKELNTSLGTITKYAFHYREHFNGMYRTDAFFFAKQVVEMPLYIIEATIMFSLIYWIANLNPEAERFFVALGIIILVLQVVFSLGYFLSCTLPTVDIALAIAPVLIIPMMLFGGFYLNSSSVVVWLAWIKYVSCPLTDLYLNITPSGTSPGFTTGSLRS